MRNAVLVNGKKVIEFTISEEHIWIPGDFLSDARISSNHRGAFADLQVWSKPMDEQQLLDWTTCHFNEPGNVYQWKIDKFNMTHDSRMVSTIEKVDRKSFCKVNEPGTTELHVIGQGTGGFSNVGGSKLCKRLNGNIALFPIDEDKALKIKNVLINFVEITNLTEIQAFVGGRARIENYSKIPHSYPVATGFWDVEDPETGDLLVNDENRKYLANVFHSYAMLEDLCLGAFYYPGGFSEIVSGKDLFYTWEKCERKLWGRVLCEFDTIPTITIKGFCQKELMDRNYQLIDIKPEQGRHFQNYICFSQRFIFFRKFLKTKPSHIHLISLD